MKKLVVTGVTELDVNYITEDYSLFINTKGNRKVKPSRLKKLSKALTKAQYPIPIICTWNGTHFVVKDGWGRKTACEALGLPIYFKLDDAGDKRLSTIPDSAVKEINSDSTNWTTDDFVDEQEINGCLHAAQIKLLMEKFSFRVGIAATIAHEKYVGNANIKSGTYPTLGNTFETHKFAKIIADAKKRHTIFGSAYFVEQLMWYLKEDGFDFKYLLKYLVKDSGKYPNSITTSSEADNVFMNILGKAGGKYCSKHKMWAANVEYNKSKK